MATVKATNPTTGKTFDVSEAEFASQYKPLGWTLGSAAPMATDNTNPASSGSPVAPGASSDVTPASSAKVETPSAVTEQMKPDAKNKYGQSMEEANNPENWKNGAYSPANKAAVDAENLVSSGKVFDENDAKAYAAAKGDTNWQQYVNSAGGKVNPLYIGSTSWAKLQQKYTPYQLNQATIRTKDGVYWNQNVNIGEIPSVDPATQINADTKKISEIVNSAKSEADKTTTDAAKKKDDTTFIADTAEENKKTLMTMLQDQYGGSAEKIYDDLYNTDEMKTAQEDVAKYKNLNDEYDQQLEDLKDDIRKEVEGEASESYITSLAAIRGDKILKLKRANQRNYDAANSNLTNLKENASSLLQVRVKDTETRYNQLFQALQLQIQQEGTAFNQEVALANIQMNLPENRSITLGGVTYKGLKEDDNLNVIQFTEANGKTYVIGVDKKTGSQKYKQYIGTAKVSSSGGEDSAVKQLAEYNAIKELGTIKDIDKKIAAGDVAVDYDEKGNSFYYDKKAYDAAYTEATTGWSAFLKKNPEKVEFRL